MGFKITVINLLAIDRHGKTELESVKKKKAKERQKTCKFRSVENKLEHERKKK